MRRRIARRGRLVRGLGALVLLIGAVIVVAAVALVVRREPPSATQIEEGVRRLAEEQRKAEREVALRKMAEQEEALRKQETLRAQAA